MFVMVYVKGSWGFWCPGPFVFLRSGVWGQEFGAPQRFVRAYVRTYARTYENVKERTYVRTYRSLHLHPPYVRTHKLVLEAYALDLLNLSQNLQS